MTHETQSPTFTLDELQSAFEQEIERVSTLSYNSNDICRTFFGKLKQRLERGGTDTRTGDEVPGDLDHEEVTEAVNACLNAPDLFPGIGKMGYENPVREVYNGSLSHAIDSIIVAANIKNHFPKSYPVVLAGAKILQKDGFIAPRRKVVLASADIPKKDGSA